MKTLLMLIAALRATSLAAQATHPPYLSQFPTVERVKKAMQVNDLVVGCRDATILRPYTVQVSGAQVVVSVQNANNPFAVAPGADGRLSGTGTIQVDGRVVAGTDGSGNITYAARSASCALGTIGPASGASAGSAGSAQPAGGPDPAAPTSTPGANGATLSVTLGIPAPPRGRESPRGSEHHAAGRQS